MPTSPTAPDLLPRPLAQLNGSRAAWLTVSTLLGLALAGMVLFGVQHAQVALAQLLPAPAALSYPGCGATLQDCINSAAPGDTINIAAGIYITSVTLNKAVSLVGAGMGATVLQALSGQRVITVTAAMTSAIQISNMTIQGGNAGSGVGGGLYILAAAQPLLQNLLVSLNSATVGGGVYAASAITLTHVTVSNNSASNGSGGGVYAASDATASDSLFQNNTVITNGSGGGVFVGGNFTGSNVIFNSNVINYGADGGGLYAGGALALTGGQFEDNSTNPRKGYGGGAGLLAFGPTSISGTQFISNTSADWGGGAYIANFLTPAGSGLTNVLFMSNTALGGGGGGLFMWFTSTLSAVDFYSNSAFLRGGGAYAGFGGIYPTMIQGGNFVSNTAFGGGGLYGDSGFTATAAAPGRQTTPRLPAPPLPTTPLSPVATAAGSIPATA
jgi:predicted outer membrane repeat protein